MSRASRRYNRTIFLGLAAMAVLIWVAVEQFGISSEEMISLFLGVLLVTGVMVGCAALVTGLWVGLRPLDVGSTGYGCNAELR